MRPDYTRRDRAFAAIDTLARAAARVSQNPMGALTQARADRPDDYELHEAIETRQASVPTSAATVTSFSQTAVSDVASVIGPASAFSQVTARALAVNLDTPAAGVLVPSMVAAVDTVSFIAPGAAVPVKQFSFGNATLSPHKAAAIVTLTRECAEHSNAEKLIRALMVENVGLSVDKLFLDDQNTDGIRPAGLRYDTAPLTSDGVTHMQEDLTTLAAAVASKASSVDDIVFVASVDIAVKIALALPNLKIPVIATGGLLTGTILAMVPSALAVAASPTIQWSVSDETVLHMEDTSPAALSAAATPNTTSAPNRSLFQTDAKALRLIFEVDWKWRTTNAIAWMTSIEWGADAE